MALEYSGAIFFLVYCGPEIHSQLSNTFPMQPVITNGLVVWGPEELRIRRMIFDFIVAELTTAAQQANRAWQFHNIEYPVLMLVNDMNDEYTAREVFLLRDECVEHTLANGMKAMIGLRPETTHGSYQYALDYVTKTGRRQALPLCVYQMGLSFRNEQDKTLKHMRLKQFNQLEFQFIYDVTTKADYPEILRAAAREAMMKLFRGEGISTEPSDRIPTYSTSTIDLVYTEGPDPEEYELRGYEMEICSMSERTDSPVPDTKNFEIAFGIDRLVHQYMRRW
jgi:hypothetical protein